MGMEKEVVYYSKFEKGIKSVLIISPLIMGLVSFVLYKRSAEEIIIAFALCFSIILFVSLFVVPLKYMITGEEVRIVKIIGRKIILYRDIDEIIKTDGRISLETPSTQQIWLKKGDVVMARLSPEKISECEKSLMEHLNEWKKVS